MKNKVENIHLISETGGLWYLKIILFLCLHYLNCFFTQLLNLGEYIKYLILFFKVNWIFMKTTVKIYGSKFLFGITESVYFLMYCT